MIEEQDDPVAAYLKAKAAAQQVAPATPSMVPQPDATRVGPGPTNPGAHQLTGVAKLASDVFEHGIPFTPIPGSSDFEHPTQLAEKALMIPAGEAAGAGIAALLGTRAGRVGASAFKRLPVVRNVVRALEETRPQAAIKPKVRLGDASAPKAPGLVRSAIDNLADAEVNSGPRILGTRRPLSLAEAAERYVAPVEQPTAAEGFIGNGMDNIAEAIRAKAARPSLNELFSAEAQAADAARAESPGLVSDIVRNQSPFKQRGATKAQLEWRAERFGNRKLP